MPRKPRNSEISTREARAKLRPGPNPYWQRIKPGAFLGYRPHRDGGGVWVARQRVELPAGGHAQRKAPLGAADDHVDANGLDVLDYGQAVDAAIVKCRELAGEDAADVEPLTVGKVLDRYLAWFASNRKSTAATRAAVEAKIRPALGSVRVDKLTAAKVRAWHLSLVAEGSAREECEECEERSRQRKATANRLLTILKAALTREWRDGRIASDAAWRRVSPFPRVDKARDRFLTEDEARRLLNACAADFRALVEAALLTGCRLGELTSLRVADYNPEAQTLRLAETKGGRVRVVHLVEDAAALLDRLTTGRKGEALVFLREDGEPWEKSQQHRRMAEACATAKISPAATFHTLRHTFASWLALAGVPLPMIAEALGHSDARMAQRYAHLQPAHVGELLRAALPRLGTEGGNVVRFTLSRTLRPDADPAAPVWCPDADPRNADWPKRATDRLDDLRK